MFHSLKARHRQIPVNIYQEGLSAARSQQLWLNRNEVPSKHEMTRLMLKNKRTMLENKRTVLETMPRKLGNTVYGVGAIASIGVIVGVVALVYSSLQLLDSVHERIMELQSKYVQLRGVVETTATSQDVDALENSMKQLQSWIGGPTERTAREELDAVREEVGELRAELRTLREQVGGRQSP
jgi:paraquat-inducible protein B